MLNQSFAQSPVVKSCASEGNVSQSTLRKARDLGVSQNNPRKRKPPRNRIEKGLLKLGVTDLQEITSSN